MNPSKRHFLSSAGLMGAATLAASMIPHEKAWAGDYRALVVVTLDGGNDGNNLLVPLDGAYADYQRARTDVLALPKDSLAALAGNHIGHQFGLHPGLKPLADLFLRERLAVLSNSGALIQPATPEQVRARSVRLPPFLMSHNDQTSFTQGAVEDTSGWAGRGLERLPSALKNRVAAVTMNSQRTLIQGQTTAVSFLNGVGDVWWSRSNLLETSNPYTQAIMRMGRMQFTNDYEREYARTLGYTLDDAVLFAKAGQIAKEPAGDFGDTSDWFTRQAHDLAMLLPVFKSLGLKRQVFQLSFGGFDHHTGQRGSTNMTQDAMLATLGRVLNAFDVSNRASGMDREVVTLVMTEFGRTLRPGSGNGSEHAWGTHYLLMGGPVRGGQVIGSFPSLILGGPDDVDEGKNGRFVPTIGTDQIGSTLLNWLGLPRSSFSKVFPYLHYFQDPTLPIIRELA